MDDTWQSISFGKDDLCQSISFGINDLCQKLSAICHQYRTAPHKFRISAGHILTNCFFARPKNVTIFDIYKCPVEENIQHISAGHILTNCFFATSREVRIYWKEIYNIQIPFFFTYSDVRWRQKFFSVEICPLDGDFTISLPICLSCPLLAIFWPPSLWGVHRTVLRAFTVYL